SFNISEHATGHLLYARFWQKFLFDKGIVPVDEFAKKLINQGMILGTSAFVYRVDGFIVERDSKTEGYWPIETPFFISCKKEWNQSDIKKIILNSYQKKTGLRYSEILKDIDDISFKIKPLKVHVDVSFVNSSDELDINAFKNWRTEFKFAEFIIEEDGTFKVSREVEKMSKSKYNVVNPDNICEEYGADALRLFEMFLGPLEQAKPWKTSGISGVYSFLKKLWKLFYNGDDFEVSGENPTKDELKILHKTIKKVEEDIENFSFNTSVATFMIAVNELTVLKSNKKQVLEPLLILLSPYAPHIAEELWSRLGNLESIATAPFPVFEAKHLVESSKNYPISFNGKMRFTLELSLDLSKEEIEKTVMSHEKTQAQLAGRIPKTIIIVPGKIVNIVG
ncbi:MAG: class I tRNA ligase family protein, partial [Polaribacter sp.]|nr:class I tRNA ligase family protein [Polaribacter sp.]